MAPDEGLRAVAYALQLAIVGLVVYGAVAGVSALLVNGTLAFGITLLPAFLAWRYDHEIDPRLAVWITAAAAIHTAGFLGAYSVQSGLLSWYDQVAHAVSASFVAGVGYALVVALDRNSERITFPEEFRFVFTLFFILAFGVAWEIVEFSAGSLTSALGDGEALVQYGIDDTVFDLVFNTLAAAAVALWGAGYFRGLTAFFSRRLSRTRRS